MIIFAYPPKDAERSMLPVQEIYRAGDEIPPILTRSSNAQVSAADPFGEISTIGWLGWHTGAVLNPDWSRVVRVGATDLSA